MPRARASRTGKASKRTAGRNLNKSNRPPRTSGAGAKQSIRKLDQMSQKLDTAVDRLRDHLEAVGGCLYELLAAEADRERRRRITMLGEAGVLHDLQTLAAALDSIPSAELPKPLIGVERYAALAVSQLARTFDVQPIHQLREVITVTEDQLTAYDWSADSRDNRMYPLEAIVLRCGWKCGESVLLKPKLIRSTPMSEA